MGQEYRLIMYRIYESVVGNPQVKHFGKSYIWIIMYLHKLTNPQSIMLLQTPGSRAFMVGTLVCSPAPGTIKLLTLIRPGPIPYANDGWIPPRMSY